MATARAPLHLLPDQPDTVELPVELFVAALDNARTQSLVTAAIDANGYSLQTVLRLPAGPWRDEMQLSHHATHDALVALLMELRMAEGRSGGETPNA